jgi:outer membrane lipoprotein carrier protein LolA
VRSGAAALLVAVAAYAPWHAANAEDALDGLMQQLAARRHGQVSFHELHWSALLERPLESSGELVYEAPDRLEQHTVTPRPETLVLDHGTITVQRGKRRYVLALADHPEVGALVDSIRATLAGDRATLERSFRVALEPGGAAWTLRLEPREARLARLVSRIVITGSGDALATVEITRADGDHSLLTIGSSAR